MVPKFPVAALSASTPAVIHEVQRLAGLVGIDVHVVDKVSAQTGVLNLSEIPSSIPKISACFHPSYAPYFVHGRMELTLPEDAEHLLELLLAAGTTRRGNVIALIGAQGGVGVSVSSAWIARILSQNRHVCLIDASPVSAGIQWLVGVSHEPGMRWADIRDDTGSLVPGRLRDSLPQLGTLRVLSADSRAAMPSTEIGVRALSALSQVHDNCVVDLNSQALLAGGIGHGMLDWADSLVIVARAGVSGRRALKMALQHCPKEMETHLLLLGAQSGECASVSLDTGIHNVWPLHTMRGLESDFAHGIRVGDRKRSAVHGDLYALTQALV